MKHLITLISLLLFTDLTQAQGTLPRTLDFWDGSFAYNRLTVSESRNDSHIVTIELSGSTLALGDKLEGLPQVWGTGDKVLLAVRKSDCDINFVKEEVECDIARVGATVSWTVNPRITKSLKTILENIKIRASKLDFSVSVLMEFDIPSDQHFSPRQKRVIVDFSQLNL